MAPLTFEFILNLIIKMGVKPRMSYLWAYNINLLILTMQAGYVVSGNNAVGGTVLKAKLGWTTKEESDTMNAYISGAGVLGLMLGSLLSGCFVA
jgi:hypothetical protein